MGQIIISHEFHVLHYPLITRVCVEQCPGGECHLYLIPANTTVVVKILLPHLVVHMIGHPIHVHAHGIPEIPYKVDDMIVRLSRIFRIPGNNMSILIYFDIMVNKVLCRQSSGKQDN